MSNVRRPHRLTALVALAVALVVAGCGDDTAVEGAKAASDAALVDTTVDLPDASVDAQLPDMATFDAPDGVDAVEDVEVAVADAGATDAALDSEAPDAAATDASVGTDAVADDVAAPDAASADLAEPDAPEPDAPEPDAPEPDAALPDSAVAEDAVVDVVLTDAVDGDGVEADGGTDAYNDAAAGSDTAAVADAADSGDAGCGPQGCWVANVPCDANHPCGAGVCDPQTLTCVACITSGDCVGGLCVSHACVAAPTCQSDFACKAAGKVCDTTLGLCVECVSNADCLGAGVCQANQCVSQTSCKSSKECPAADVCDVQTGVCVGCVKATDCAFGHFCNGAQQCQAAVCKENQCVSDGLFVCKSDGGGFQPAKPCADDNACTTDACDAIYGCTHVPGPGTCDDGDACTHNDVCDGAICGGTFAGCDDGSPCTTDSCDPTTGCTHTPYAGACDDGSLCTVKDICTAGTCQGTAIGCVDGNKCTGDTCQPASGCVFLPNNATCDDGNACTAGDFCHVGSCQGDSAVVCNDGDPCTNDSCAPTGGCQTTANTGAACDDGSACTQGDVCTAGLCGGGLINCSDDNVCTSDGCDPASGCVFPAKAGPCDDGDVCSVADQCLSGQCQAGAAKVCSDGNPCTVDNCAAFSGCGTVPAPGSVACDDGNPCTSGDACSAGQCQPTGFASCDDGDKCTTDACIAPGGCVHGVAQGLCDDGDSCTYDVCTANACSHTAKTLGLWTSGGAADDGAVGVVLAADGTMTVLGTTSSKGSGAGDFWLQQVNGDGVTVLDLALGTTGTDAAAGIAPRLGGGFWLVGKTTAGGLGGEDGWLLGVDAGGKGIVDMKAGTAGQDAFAAVASMPDGGVVVAGTRGAGASSLGNSDAWVARFSATGQLAWTVPTGLLGGAGADLATGVTVTTGGDIVVAYGQAKSAAATTVDARIARLDSAGKVLWNSSVVDTATNAVPAAVIAAADGTFVVVGTASPGTVGFAARFTTGGERLWYHTYGSPGQQTLTGVRQLSDGGFACVGTTDTGSGKDAWLIRTDAFGDLRCAEVYGGAAADIAAALEVMADGRVVWVGSTASSGAGGSDGWRGIVDAWGHATCGAAGVCLSATLAACDDGNRCTVDSCESVIGCVHTPLSGACSDGDACTTGEQCVNNACTGGTVVTCNDNDVCTSDVCDSKLGCYHTSAPTGTPCNDGDACRSGDTCKDRGCAAGAPIVCPAGGACQLAACDPKTGCKLANKPDGTACGSYACGSSTCSLYCSAGVCK